MQNQSPKRNFKILFKNKSLFLKEALFSSTNSFDVELEKGEAAQFLAHDEHSSNKTYLIKIFSIEDPESKISYEKQKKALIFQKQIEFMIEGQIDGDFQKNNSKVGIIVYKNISNKVCFENFSEEELIEFFMKTLENIKSMSEKQLVLLRFCPDYFYRNLDEEIMLGNFQYLTQENNKNDLISKEKVFNRLFEKEWEYLGPQLMDVNEKGIKLNESAMTFSLGCLIYKALYKNYPFKSKEEQLKYHYQKEDGFFKIFFQKIFLHWEKRTSVKELIEIYQKQIKLKQITNKNFSLSTLLDNKSKQKIIGISFFNGIQEVFNKFTKQTQGWYLNYTENSEVVDEKYVDFILRKLYKNNSKLKKLQQTMIKHINRTEYGSKINFLLKNYLLIFQILRKAPSMVDHLDYWTKIKEEIILTSNKQNVMINEMYEVLSEKIKILSLYTFLAGNFYLERLQKFKKMDVSDIKRLTNYLESLIKSFQKIILLKEALPLLQIIYRIYCDQIYDLISSIILFVICLRKDIDLKLRDQQNIQKYMPEIQRKLKQFLMKISKISVKFSSHPIYLIEKYYIQYQEQLQYDQEKCQLITTLRYFYQHCQEFKGLRVPINYQEVYKKDQINNSAVNTLNKKEEVALNQSNNYQNNQNCQNEIENDLKRENFKKNINKSNNSYKSKEKQNIKDVAFIELNDFTVKQLFSNFYQETKTIIQPTIIPFHIKTPQNIKNHTNLNKAEKNVVIKSFNFEDLSKSNILSYEWLERLQKSNNLLNFLPSIPSPQEFSSDESAKKLNFMLEDLKLPDLKAAIKQNKSIMITFQKLKFDKMIGSGSAGEVYLGSYEKQVIAIKKVKLESNPNALKEFQRELLTYIKIKRHPFLVSLIGLSKKDKDYYLLTEFCEQGMLFDILHRKKIEIQLSWKQKISMALQIAKGMLVLHSMKPVIIHRDLKSLNIFVMRKSNEWIAKVADFGLSRSPDSQMMTSALGTLHWMAPELLQNRQYSLKVDVYSFAILLWEICARITPYHDLGSPMAIIKHVTVENKRPKLQYLEPNCPIELINLMQKCWNRDSSLRPFFTQIIAELEGIRI